MAKGDGERETPDVAGKRLQAQLDVLCPNLKPAPHPRGYPMNRDEVEQLCQDEAERTRLHKAIGIAAARSGCGLCGCADVGRNPEATGLAILWKVDFARLEWRLSHVTPACLHCCTASNTDTLLNAALCVSDSAGGVALQGLSARLLAANGHAQDKPEIVQAALNVAHSIKVLAANLPCRVVNDKGAAVAPGGVAALCIQCLEQFAAGGGRIEGKQKGGKKEALKKGCEIKATAKQVGLQEEEEEQDEESIKSAKKSKTTTTQKVHTPVNTKIPAKTGKTPAKVDKRPKTPGKSKVRE